LSSSGIVHSRSAATTPSIQVSSPGTLAATLTRRCRSSEDSGVARIARAIGQSRPLTASSNRRATGSPSSGSKLTVSTSAACFLNNRMARQHIGARSPSLTLDHSMWYLRAPSITPACTAGMERYDV
jgi:hypothetical protein